MVLFAPGHSTSEIPAPAKARKAATKPEPDQEKIVRQARYILKLTKIIRELQTQIQILLRKPTIHQLNQLEIDLMDRNKQLTRLKILALISVSVGIIGTVPNCLNEVEKSVSLLTETAK